MRAWRWLLAMLIGMLLVAGVPARAQQTDITLDVSAGFDGRFRENRWMPIQIVVVNDGPDVSGRLVIRPETSGNGIANAYSVPIELPAGARKTVFLYVVSRSFTTELRVELLNVRDEVLAAQPATVRSILPQDQLYVVLSESSVGVVDMTGARTGSADAFQTNWGPTDLPDRVEGLTPVNMMLVYDVDTSAISEAQGQALRDWVAQGGHLVVASGVQWQATASGLTELLPFAPSGSADTGNLQALAALAGVPDERLEARSVITVGNVQPRAQVLAETEAGQPLLIRHTLGEGTIDYLTADPGAAPLRGWPALNALWFTLATSIAPQPGWSNGITNYERAIMATEILPGFDALPAALPLCGFLALYIVLIGPLNYLILNRINRREWAWFTIPALIIVFSALAWFAGFNLRGNVATLNRLAVVQLWPDVERAQVDGLIGLLSPRRTAYTLTVSEGMVLRPTPRDSRVGLLDSGTMVNSEISQSAAFTADTFRVDASFIAGFVVSGTTEKPAIRGSASVNASTETPGLSTVRGSVTNDTGLTLTEPVILARGVTYRLEQPITPGEIATFTLDVPGTSMPASAPTGDGALAGLVLSAFSARSFTMNEQSVIDILGDETYEERAYFTGGGDDVQQTMRRRQAFLSALTADRSGSTGRGNRVYFAAWATTSPMDVTVEGASWDAQDTTLYLVELDVDPAAGNGEQVITQDQFTWAVRSYSGPGDVTPVNLNMQVGNDAVFRFTPIPGAQLETVEQLSVQVTQPNVTGEFTVELWDWAAGVWRSELVRVGENVIRNPQRYLGPLNAVEIKVTPSVEQGFMQMRALSVSMRGTF